MSQHDLNIANQGFPAFRADLNDALVALGTTNSGATAPATTFANQLWYDTANNILKIRNEDNDAWISIATLDQTGDLVSAIGSTTLANLVTLAGTQTLTNKTLTSPAINGQTVDKITDTQGGVFTPSSAIMRNRIINGAMVIDQRNAGASVTLTTATLYPVDRFATYEGTAGATVTAQRSTVVPTGFTNSLLFTVSTGASPASGDINGFWQSIEGFNVADLGYGTANAKTVTLSFWVRSSVTGTYSVSFNNGDVNRYYVANYVINAANTWEQKTVTIAGDTSGTWNTGNGTGLQVIWDLGYGSSFDGTAGSWGSSTNRRTSGSVSLVATTGATFYITGVQLEVGTQATSFEYRQYQQELALCQRYYEVGNFSNMWSGYIVNGNNYFHTHKFSVTKRAAPTMTYADGGDDGFTNAAAIVYTSHTTEAACYKTSNATTNAGYYNYSWTASIEL
jgi:hypothetical protein